MTGARFEVVNRLAQSEGPRSTSRSFGLLVCALLLGLVAMHGLGPVPHGGAGSGHDRTAAVAPGDARMPTQSMSSTASMTSAPELCDHGEGGCGGHAEHADPTCAAASVAGPPVVVPVLLPDVAGCAARPWAGLPPADGGPDGGRAPPSLAELQLLRI